MLPLLQVKEFWPDISLGGAFFTPGHAAMTLSDNWPRDRGELDDARPHGVVLRRRARHGRGSGAPVAASATTTTLRYELSNEDLAPSQQRPRAPRDALARGRRDRGATRRVAGVPSDPHARSTPSGGSTRRLPASRAQPHDRPRVLDVPDRRAPRSLRGDSYGKLHGFDNLYVNDASMLPDSPGVNPQGTRDGVRATQRDHFPRVSPMTLALVTGAPGWLGTRLVTSLLRGFPDVPSLAARAVGACAASSSPTPTRPSSRRSATSRSSAATSPIPRPCDAFVADAKGATRLPLRGHHPSDARHVRVPRRSTSRARRALRRRGEARGRAPHGARLVELAASATNPTPDRRLRRARAVPPVHGLRQERRCSPSEIVSEAHARGRSRDGHHPPAVVLRPGPAAAADRSSSR